MTPARIAIVGGGPGGLFLAALLKRRDPSLDVVLYERNQRGDAFGFGVVFSDATLSNIDAADPVLRDGLRDFGRHWDRIEVWNAGERHGFGGNGMAAIHRKVLLRLLQDNAEAAGAELRFGAAAPPLSALRRDFDLVVGADGTNSGLREELAAGGSLGHEVDEATAKFIWFGTTYGFDGLTFVHRVSDHGNFAAHAYPISDELSTFIVETDAETWRRAGLDRFDVGQPPGVSDERSQEYLEKLFSDDLEGAPLVANNSRWANFRTRRTACWWRDDVVLLGDAVHTAHFSVGSGTKMAMEDAIVLAAELTDLANVGAGLSTALTRYQQTRQRSVAKIQAAAGPSLSWWERFGRYQQRLDAATFAFHFFSRSIGVDRIAQRDPELVGAVRAAWVERFGRPPLESSFELPTGAGPVHLPRRLTVGRGGHDHVLVGHGEDGTADRVTVPMVSAGSDQSPPTPDGGRFPPAVAVVGPPSLARTLLAEDARLRGDTVVIMVGDDLADDAAAETVLLSGRADAVGVWASETGSRS